MPLKYFTVALLFLLWSSSLLLGCNRQIAPPLTAEEIEEATKDQPQIFLFHEGNLTLEGLEGLYLGQEFDAAMKALHEHCEVLEIYDGGWRHKNAVFKGCIIDIEETTRTVRVGFWPHNQNRVSTLEIKEDPIPMRVVRARFSQIAGALTMDLPRRGLLMMTDENYRLFASWDDGEAEAAHILVGFQP